MDKSDYYLYGPMVAMLAWMMGYRVVAPSLSGNTVFGISVAILLGPIVVLELYVTQVTSSCPYVRAVVEPHGEVMRFYIKDYDEVRGDVYSTRRIRVNWPVRTHYHGKVDEIIIRFEGNWSDRVQYSRGKARLWEYEVDHRATENLILYEFMEGTLDYDHTKEIPCYYLAHASGDYYDKMGLIEYDFEDEETEFDVDPLEEVEDEVEVE